jgi:hypothetical protein
MRPNNEDAHGLTRQAAWINCNDYRMNALVSKFSTTDADSEIRTAMDIAENDGLTDAMWGSQAGFGQIVKGHAFNIPPVPDVRFGKHLFLSTVISWHIICSILAHCIPEASHR